MNIQKKKLFLYLQENVSKFLYNTVCVLLNKMNLRVNEIVLKADSRPWTGPHSRPWTGPFQATVQYSVL